MNALEKLYAKLDESDYDCRDASTINKEFQEVIAQLVANGDTDLVYRADIDRQVFSVNKSFEYSDDDKKGTLNGLSWQMAGNKTFDDGHEEPFYWPDVRSFTITDFAYFEKRWNECKNLYAKTEYGLLVYFGKKNPYSKNRIFHRQLFRELFNLAELYGQKAKAGGEKNFYILDYFRILKLVFGIAQQSKLNPEFNEITAYLYNLHQTWDISANPKTRIISDIAGLFSENYSQVKNLIDFHLIMSRNFDCSLAMEKINPWSAIYMMDLNKTLAQKTASDATLYLKNKARLYEALMDNAEKESNMASIRFAEDALEIYRQLDDKTAIERLENKYSELRGKFQLTTFREELPETYTSRIAHMIEKSIAENNNEEILKHFIITPWYESLDIIKDRSVELAKISVLSSILPVAIVDKLGNTIEVFQDEEEKKEHGILSSYNNSFQIGTQTMCNFFFSAWEADKFNKHSTLSYLEQTWYNEPIERSYHGNKIIIKPIDTLIPVISRIFEELDKYRADNTYMLELVTIIDSLSLRVEGLLRYLCERAGISTFKKRQKGGDQLMMEKLIDDLLADLQDRPAYDPERITNFKEEHRFFIKFVMTEKAGWNLRNAVAHSLLDRDEYTFDKVVVLFSIVMKLSSYKFK